VRGRDEMVDYEMVNDEMVDDETEMMVDGR